MAVHSCSVKTSQSRVWLITCLDYSTVTGCYTLWLPPTLPSWTHPLPPSFGVWDASLTYCVSAANLFLVMLANVSIFACPIIFQWWDSVLLLNLTVTAICQPSNVKIPSYSPRYFRDQLKCPKWSRVAFWQNVVPFPLTSWSCLWWWASCAQLTSLIIYHSHMNNI